MVELPSRISATRVVFMNCPFQAKTWCGCKYEFKNWSPDMGPVPTFLYIRDNADDGDTDEDGVSSNPIFPGWHETAHCLFQYGEAI